MDLLAPSPPPDQRASKLRRGSRPAKSKRFSFALGKSKGTEEEANEVLLDSAIQGFTPATSAYRLPLPPQPAPQPGIRVSSLGGGPAPARPRSASLQRSLSSPASLRSRSVRDDSESGLNAAVSPDCLVGSSRAHFTTPALSIVADYYATTIDEEYVLPLTEETDSARSSYYSCHDYEAERNGLPTRHSETLEMSGSDNHDDLLLESFARFTRSDARLTAAVEALAHRQDAMQDRLGVRRAVARRTSSLPLLPHVDLATAPIPPPATTPARSAWQAISAMMRFQPDLPSPEEAESPSSDESEEEEPDPRLLIRLAVDDVRAAQSNLLACLSELAAITGLSEHHGYEQQILVSAQNVIADANFNVELDEMQDLRALAMRACEALEQVRELSASLVPPAPRSLRRNRVHVSAIVGSLPVAPQRASSLPNVNRVSPHTQTLLSALSAWDKAYRGFARRWRHHQHTIRVARRQARAQRRMTQIVSIAHRHGIQKELAASDGLGTVTATAQLVATTLERAIADGLITRQEAIHLDPRVFFALPRLSILYGARDALLPASWETPSPRIGCLDDVAKPERPLTLFLPRVCGSLNNEMIRMIRGLSEPRLSLLAQILSGQQQSNVPRLSSLASSDPEVWELYRDVAALADRESIGGQKWGRALSRCLKAWAAEQISLHEQPIRHHRL